MEINSLREITPKEAAAQVDDSVSRLDELRLGGLQELNQLQQIKNELLDAEIKRLKSEYGDTHPRVVRMTVRSAYNREMFAGLNQEIEKAKTNVEPMPKDSWRVNGKVYNDKNNPVKGVIVFLAGKANNSTREPLKSITDESGYYAITIGSELAHILEKEGQPFFIKISDRKGNQVYSGTDPLLVAVGAIRYMNIYLGEDNVQPPLPQEELPRSRKRKIK